MHDKLQILESANTMTWICKYNNLNKRKAKKINKNIKNLPVHMCVALPLLVQNAPGDVFMKLFEPTKEYKQGNRVKAEIKEFQKLCRNISIKKSLAEIFLKKKSSVEIFHWLHLSSTHWPASANLVSRSIGHSFLVSILTHFSQLSSLSLSDTVSYFQYQPTFPFINSIIIIIYHPIGHKSLVQILTHFLFINRFHRRRQRQNYAILVSQITFYESSLLLSLPIN